ncbi:hypothetical protein G7Y89_g7004 [Cudoniella acicularis]|uniref:NADP-dependent oxidoreductase domain-containing protein n=1 Tax=Cudoniella acicularis TaxID=354080 RepID=A0A8H4RK72_9HELO|nr:hypothetical protein G7Y89_g7004 [Cudoniella acicularis]
MTSSTSLKGITTLLQPFIPKSYPDVKIPRLIYGTAWKKERSTELVYQAIKAGFRAIDTAAQPRHYREDLVAAGIRRAIEEGIVTREELYVRSPTPPLNFEANTCYTKRFKQNTHLPRAKTLKTCHILPPLL